MSADALIVELLASGSIRLLDVHWLLETNPGSVDRRQELPPSALLTPSVAVDLMRRQDRSVFALTYPWLTARTPDPEGDRVHIVRQFFLDLQNTGRLPQSAGLFWDFASLPQWPRTEDEDRIFGEGLQGMAHLYASCLGVAVLQSKEIPTLPADSALAGSILVKGITLDELRHEAPEALAVIETLSGCPEASASASYARYGNTRVRFPSHACAIEALSSIKPHLPPAVHALMEYSDTPYDKRGWTTFETQVALEGLGRSTRHREMRAEMAKLPRAKLYLLRRGRPVRRVNASTLMSATRFEERIQRAAFTNGNTDRAHVLKLFRDHRQEIAFAAQPQSYVYTQRREVSSDAIDPWTSAGPTEVVVEMVERPIGRGVRKQRAEHATSLGAR